MERDRERILTKKNSRMALSKKSTKSPSKKKLTDKSSLNIHYKILNPDDIYIEKELDIINNVYEKQVHDINTINKNLHQTLTGNIDVDIMIMKLLSDYDLYNICKINKKTYKLCQNVPELKNKLIFISKYILNPIIPKVINMPDGITIAELKSLKNLPFDKFVDELNLIYKINNKIVFAGKGFSIDLNNSVTNYLYGYYSTDEFVVLTVPQILYYIAELIPNGKIPYKTIYIDALRLYEDHDYHVELDLIY